MKYFILQQDKEVVEVAHYLKQKHVSPEFLRFIRREWPVEVSKQL